jgi:hypothetical protein
LELKAFEQLVIDIMKKFRTTLKLSKKIKYSVELYQKISMENFSSLDLGMNFPFHLASCGHII